MSLSLLPHDIMTTNVATCVNTHIKCLNSTTAATATTKDCTIISSPEEPPHIGVVHPRANADKTGINYIEHKITISHYQQPLYVYVYVIMFCILITLTLKAYQQLQL